MSYPKQAGFSPPVLEPTAPACEEPLVVQQVFVVQQPGGEPVHVADNIVQSCQLSPFERQPLTQPLVSHPVFEQPQQPVQAVQGKIKRRKNDNMEPEGVKDCCKCYYCFGDTLFCLLCCPFYVLKWIFD